MTYASEVLADSPDLYWKLDESSGTTAADSSGHGRSGTATGVTFGSGGPISGSTAASFAAGHVSSTFTPTYSALTVECWFNLNGNTISGNPRLVSCGHPDTDFKGWDFALANSLAPGGVTAVVGNNSSMSQGVMANLAKLGFSTGWHHYVMSWDGSTIRIYIDGYLSQYQAYVAGSSIAETGIAAGWNPVYGGDPLTGKLAHVAVYPTRLSEARILAHYLAVAPFAGSSTAWREASRSDGAAVLYAMTDVASTITDYQGVANGAYNGSVFHDQSPTVPGSTGVQFFNGGSGNNGQVNSFPAMGGNFSLEIIGRWFSLPSGSPQGIIQIGSESNFFLRASDVSLRAGQLNGGFGGTSFADPGSANDLGVGVPSHIAVTFDGTTGRLYLNGVQVSTLTTTGAVGSSTFRFPWNFINGRESNCFLAGIAYTPSALTAAQIASHSAAALTGIPLIAPTTPVSFSVSGVTINTPIESRPPISRAAAPALAPAPRSGVTGLFNFLDTQARHAVALTSNGGIHFSRSTGLTAFLPPIVSPHPVTRSPVAPAPRQRFAAGITKFLVVRTRRPNDTQGSVRSRTDLTGSLRLAERLNSGVIAGSTSVSARLGFLISLSGEADARSQVTASMGVAHPVAPNDNFVDRIRIWTGGILTGDNGTASLQSDSNNYYDYYYFGYFGTSAGGHGQSQNSVWYSWFPPIVPYDGTRPVYLFQVRSSDFIPLLDLQFGKPPANFDFDPGGPNINPTISLYNYPPYEVVASYIDGQYVATAYTYGPLASYARTYIYIRIAAAGNSYSVTGNQGGAFELEYPPGVAPDGSYANVVESLRGSVKDSTVLHSRLPYVTADGYVDLAKLGPGELANADEPCYVRAGTVVTPPTVIIDTPRYLGLDNRVAVEQPNEDDGLRELVSEAGTGTRNQTTTTTTTVPNGTASLVTGVSTLSPYYV